MPRSAPHAHPSRRPGAALATVRGRAAFARTAFARAALAGVVLAGAVLAATPAGAAPARDFADAANNRGLGVDGAVAADLDGAGNSLSATALAAAGLAPGARVTHGRATFTLPAPHPVTGDDNVVALGQTIALPAEHRVRATAIGLLAVSTCGATGPVTMTATYTDGTTSNPWLPAVPDWADGDADGSAAVLLPHRLAGTAPDPGVRPAVHAVFGPTDPTKTLLSVTLPRTSPSSSTTCGLHVLAIAPAPVATGWLGAWAAVPDRTDDLSTPGGQTLRFVVRPGREGADLRLKLSNTTARVPA
ncbi:hypothetical protein ACR807_12325, partial [Saccharothrix sp. Mg75]